MCRAPLTSAIGTNKDSPAPLLRVQKVELADTRIHETEAAEKVTMYVIKCKQLPTGESAASS